ncbi:MAG: T9SS type B sorting domain-containing protein [Flavobacteriaceae bacterium]|nr:T9SS type B sorting domain-containing protein [Flavobacteriaceae bacterium]
MRDNLLLYVFMLVVASINAQLVVDASYSPQKLVEEVLTKSRCATTASYQSYSGNAFGVNGMAYFSYNGDDFPFKEGVILSTGAAANAVGPNDRDLGDGLLKSAWGGDADLQNITNTPNTVNATYLQFEFVPSISNISFDFIFASEEYNELFQCDFSDVFAFILTDSKGNSRNLAVVPGTTTPIKVTTVHGNLKGSKCNAINETYFDSYNDPVISVTNFNGQTVPITARADVVPGEVYTIKLVIGDQVDGNYDSAVFLEAGSFKISGDLGEDRTIENGNPVCDNSSVVLNPNLYGNATYTWYKDGAEIAGATAENLEVTESGYYEVVYALDTGCAGRDDIRIEFSSVPNLKLLSEILLCEADNDQQEAFNLLLATSKLEERYKNSLQFFEDQDAIDANEPITNVENYTNKQNPQTIKIGVTNQYGCVSYHDLTLRIDAFPNINTSPNSLQACMVEANTVASFDLSQVESQIYPGGGLVFTYYKSRETAAQGGQNGQISQFQNYGVQTIGNSTVYVRVATHNALCYQIVPLQLEVNNPPELELEDQYVICVENTANRFTTTIDTSLDMAQHGFKWYRGRGVDKILLNNQQGSSLEVDQTQLGWYTLEVRNATSCIATRSFEVVQSLPPGQVEAEVVSKPYESNQRILVTVAGEAKYLYRINGGNWQEDPNFGSLAYGFHTVEVRDVLGCFVKSVNVKIIDYPRFFSPNGDGINDKWNIFEALELPATAKVLVFDKYGKLLKKLSKQNNDWDGTLNGKQLPSDNYWFRVSFTSEGKGNDFNGYFALKR